MRLSDHARYLSCTRCNWTRPESAADAMTTVACFLRRGICCLKALRSPVHDSTHHGEQETANLTNFHENSCDIITKENECDAESTDSGVQISQESTVGSVSELMAATPHRTTDLIPSQVTSERAVIRAHQMFPSTPSEARNAVYYIIWYIFLSPLHKNTQNILNLRKTLN